MKRRDFLVSSAAVTTAASTSLVTRTHAQSSGDDLKTAQYYEWRTYRFKRPEQGDRVQRYLQKAALPAWNRLGVGPVGVWTESGDGAGPSVHVLLTFSSIEQFAGQRAALEADAAYQSSARDYLEAPKDDPAYARIESSLMVAFDGMKKLHVPAGSPKAYELRIYESHNEAKARRKIEMFNDGEIPIFSEVGFQPVFFGETLIGPLVPNLKYMLATEDAAANKAAWQRFGSNPDWVAMRSLPKYADTVSGITSIMLTPTSYSEI